MLLISSAAADQPTSARAVKVDRVHDGDTVFGSIDLGYGLSLTPDGGIRASGYDAWEVNRIREQFVGPISDEELRKGRIATKALIDLLLIPGAKLFSEDSGDRDPHGRISAKLWLRMPGNGWLDVGAWMEAHGHCRPPEGR